MKLLISFFIVLSSAAVTHAQMFSVGEQGPEASDSFFNYTSLSVGWDFAEFTYSGDAGDELILLDRFDFKNGVLRLLFESPGLNMYLGTAGETTGMENQNYFNIGAVLYNDFVISRSENFWLMLPVQIGTDLKRSHKEGSGQQFQQSSFQAGAGLGIRARLSDGIDIQSKFLPHYGFSFSQGNIFGGNVSSLKGSARIYINNIFPNNAIVLGYNFDQRSYDVDGDDFDYDYTGHAVILGITF